MTATKTHSDVEIEKLSTNRPDYFVRVNLTYNDGSMRRSSRGYYVSVYVIREEPGMWTCNMMGAENKTVLIEKCDRFSAKRFAEIEAAMHVTHHGLRLEVERAIDKAKELAPTITI